MSASVLTYNNTQHHTPYHIVTAMPVHIACFKARFAAELCCVHVRIPLLMCCSGLECDASPQYSASCLRLLQKPDRAADGQLSHAPLPCVHQSPCWHRGCSQTALPWICRQFCCSHWLHTIHCLRYAHSSTFSSFRALLLFLKNSLLICCVVLMTDYGVVCYDKLRPPLCCY